MPNHIYTVYDCLDELHRCPVCEEHAQLYEYIDYNNEVCIRIGCSACNWGRDNCSEEIIETNTQYAEYTSVLLKLVNEWNEQADKAVQENSLQTVDIKLLRDTLRERLLEPGEDQLTAGEDPCATCSDMPQPGELVTSGSCSGRCSKKDEYSQRLEAMYWLTKYL